MPQELTDYERGYLDGLWAYGWWKDGTVYVGTTGRTYREAAVLWLHERGYLSCEVQTPSGTLSLDAHRPQLRGAVSPT